MVPEHSPVLLLVTEMQSAGGIQAYMHRLREVWEGDPGGVTVVSLNDASPEPQAGAGRFVGASRSKSAFIRAALRAGHRDAVVVIGHVALLPVAALLRLSGRARRLVLVLHGIEAWQRLPLLQRLSLAAVKTVVATTRYTSAVFSRLNPVRFAEQRVIPLCADESLPETSSAPFLSGSLPLLCVARQSALERYKGFEPMFEALRILDRSVPGLHLNLVGAGDDQERLKARADSMGVADQVTFWGRIDEQRLQAAYRDCAVFVMPSKAEGFGIVYLEAMRHGKPCIGGNHAGAPEVIAEGVTGYLADHDDPQQLADRIRALAVDPLLRARMGEAGKAVVRSEFSTGRFAQRWRDATP